MALLEVYDLAQLRTYVAWTPPTDETLEAAALVLQDAGEDPSWQRVARDQVRAKLAELLGKPTSFSVSGEYGESWAANITALREMVRELDMMIPGSPGAFTAGRVERQDRSRGPLPHGVTEVGPLLG